MKPFCPIRGNALKPASGSIRAAGWHKGVDHVDADFEFVSGILPGTPA
jgi:hypothetical protein